MNSPAAGLLHVVDHHRPAVIGQAREHILGIPRGMPKFHGQPGSDLGTGEFRARGREKTFEPIFVHGQRWRKLKEDAREPRTQRRELLDHLIEIFFTSDKPLAVRDRLAGLEREGEVRGHGVQASATAWQPRRNGRTSG